MRDAWMVAVDIFDVTLAFKMENGKAHLVESSCNCDISSEVCRHVAIAEGRVQAVFDDADLAGIKGTITHAPAVWRPLVSEDERVESSELHL
jgi:hypothetical protein